MTDEEFTANADKGITKLTADQAKKYELLGADFTFQGKDTDDPVEMAFESDCEIFKATNGTVTYANGDWGNMAPKQGAVIMVYKVGEGGEETDVLMADKVVYTTTQLDAAAIKDIAKNFVLAADEELGDVYTDRDLSTGKVESAQSLEAKQTYKFYVKINKVVGQITEEHEYSLEGLQSAVAVGDSTDDVVLTNAHFNKGTVSDKAYDNSWIQVAEKNEITPENASLKNSANIKYNTKNSVLAIKNIALKVTFKGKGTLVINFSSTGTGATNISGLALLDSDGKYVTTGEITGGDHVTKVDNSFKVQSTGKDNQVTFTINAAGTYYIVGDASFADTGRDTRIHAIKMTDMYAPEA